MGGFPFISLLFDKRKQGLALGEHDIDQIRPVSCDGNHIGLPAKPGLLPFRESPRRPYDLLLPILTVDPSLEKIHRLPVPDRAHPGRSPWNSPFQKLSHFDREARSHGVAEAP